MNVYFSGIGGTGMGPLVDIAIDMGYEVLGSDLIESLNTQELRRRNVTINIGQDGNFLQSSHRQKPIDWLIYTSALPADHPELLMAKKLGIRASKRHEFINHVAEKNNLKLVGVAGTHGKTTTTAMLVWALQQLKIPVSYCIGATLPFGPSGRFENGSQYFVFECDEYDRSFLNFRPFLSVIISIDYDHPDIYPTIDDYLSAFHQFASASSQVITWSDQHKEIFADLNQVTILDASTVNETLRIAGECNRRNATTAQYALKCLGINQPTDDILSNFPGTNRRFEKLADNLYSDYSHHPTEIAATMQLAHELSDHVVVVYQPHQNIRQYSIRDQYTNQFELADVVYWVPTYEPTARDASDLPTLKPSELIQNITNKDRVQIANLDESLWNTVQAEREAGNLVLIMGAGNIDAWLRKNLKNN